MSRDQTKPEPTDIRAMFEREFLGAWDLQGRDCTVEIEAVKGVELFVASANAKRKKPVITFRGTPKKLACNKTNSETIASMYGYDTRAWVGKRITLYPTTTKCGGKVVDAIRVRPKVPRGAAGPIESQPVDPEMRARQNEAAEELAREHEEGRDG